MGGLLAEPLSHPQKNEKSFAHFLPNYSEFFPSFRILSARLARDSLCFPWKYSSCGLFLCSALENVFSMFYCEECKKDRAFLFYREKEGIVEGDEENEGT